jgi:acyl-CoA synthetase (AMP-forming)/AMP-acid ligase II
MDNMQIHILDEQLQPAPIGVPGELHIGGVCVARGYQKRPELTAEKFIDPFGSGVLYKSGDVTRWAEDGSVIYMGRIDSQVKLRGQRVELGEIEQAILDEGSARLAAAIVHESAAGGQWLVAYVSPASVDDTALKSYLQGRMPAFMVPDTIVTLEHAPLTPNGKIDHKQLPAPDVSTMHATEIVAPRSVEEAAARGAFAAALGLDAEAISVEASFLELGGNSLTAIRIRSLLQRYAGDDIELPARLLFTHPTARHVARFLGDGTRALTAEPTPAGPADLEPLDAALGPNLVVLHEGDSALVPLVIACTMYGQVTAYLALAALMPANVRGVEHGFLRTGDHAYMQHTSLEGLAREHAALILPAAPAFHVMGGSFGATLAAKIAVAARDLGGEPRAVVMVDPFWPGLHPVRRAAH